MRAPAPPPIRTRPALPGQTRFQSASLSRQRTTAQRSLRGQSPMRSRRDPGHALGASRNCGTEFNRHAAARDAHLATHGRWREQTSSSRQAQCLSPREFAPTKAVPRGRGGLESTKRRAGLPAGPGPTTGAAGAPKRLSSRDIFNEVLGRPATQADEATAT